MDLESYKDGTLLYVGVDNGGKILVNELLAIIGASLIVFSIDPASTKKRVVGFLRTPFMRFLGKYSYAMYIFHFPLAWFLENAGFGVNRYPSVAGSHIPGVIIFSLLTAGLTAIAALISWNLFEKHLLRLKKYFPRAEEKPLVAVEPIPVISHITF